mgnify:CR=1 FL=1
MKIEDLVGLLGKTRGEVEEMLNKEDVIELKLSEGKSKHKDKDKLKIHV